MIALWQGKHMAYRTSAHKRVCLHHPDHSQNTYPLLTLTLDCCNAAKSQGDVSRNQLKCCTKGIATHLAMRQSQDGIRLMLVIRLNRFSTLATSPETTQAERREANYVSVYC